VPFLWKKPNTQKRERKNGKEAQALIDASVLKKNNISRLTIDERWIRLFVNLPMSPAIEKAQNEMNELIKKEAMLLQEQESLEPRKKKVMNRIISLTKDAFDNNDEAAKSELRDCRKEIERINERMEKILEDIEKVNNELKVANIRLLNETVRYVFSTLRSNRERAETITRELERIRQKEQELQEELDSINLDWTSYAVQFTELLGSDLVKTLESQYGLEGLKHETDNSGTDAKN